jgi:hypothetical protein
MKRREINSPRTAPGRVAVRAIAHVAGIDGRGTDRNLAAPSLIARARVVERATVRGNGAIETETEIDPAIGREKRIAPRKTAARTPTSHRWTRERDANGPRRKASGPRRRAIGPAIPSATCREKRTATKRRRRRKTRGANGAGNRPTRTAIETGRV